MNEPTVTVAIGGREFLGWEQVTIKRSLDSFSTLDLSAPFEPFEPDFRETFQPFSYKSLQAKVDGEVLFTGQLVGVEPKVTPESTSIRCSGYSLPAVLGDSMMPASEFPIEYGKMNLRQIAETLAQPFGVAVGLDVGSEDGPKFKRIGIKPTEKIGAFLGKLARARGLVMRDNEDGKLIFLNSAQPGNPVVDLNEGELPLQEVSATFSPQSYYSEITGLSRTKAGRKGAGHTVRNENLPDVVRPLSFTVGDVNAGDLPGATRARMARMFGNMVAYVVKVPTWLDPNGVLWQPNTTVTLYAPGAMVYRKTELLVRDVILRAQSDSQTASLGLVLPGAFSGEQPEVLPWA